MNFKTIIFKETEPGIGLITLNRPDRLNAISLDMLDELYSLFAFLRNKQDLRIIIITGAGRGFCSGADLKDERMNCEEGIKLFSGPYLHLENIQKKFSGIILEMRRLPQTIIAAVNGPAAGGGLCITLASDIIIANTKASFTPSFINIGLSGGELGTTYFLPKMIGSARASEILMTGRTVSSEEAERIGMISRLVSEENFMSTVLDTARTMLGKNPLGLRLTKEAIRQNLDAPSLESAIELENRNQSICCCSPDFLNAVSKFTRSGK